MELFWYGTPEERLELLAAVERMAIPQALAWMRMIDSRPTVRGKSDTVLRRSE